jgi:hypothetical protein
MKCRHCGRAPRSRPRGLCWNCFYAPGVRDLYPITSKFARRGILDINGKRPLPTCPTRAMPGSTEKILVLEERARMKQNLWHPEDAPFEQPNLAKAG